MFETKEKLFMALISGKKLHKIGTPDHEFIMMDNGKIVNMQGKEVEMENAKPEEWEFFVDQELLALKKAFEEGAIIESNGARYTGWLTNPAPNFGKDKEYRIKGGISIEAWNKYKDVIKHWWNGGQVEWIQTGMMNPKWELCDGPTWSTELGVNYRIADPIYYRWKRRNADGSVSVSDWYPNGMMPPGEWDHQMAHGKKYDEI